MSLLRTLFRGPTPAAQVRVSSSAQTIPTQGLIHVDYDVDVPPGVRDPVLEVHVGAAAEPALRRPAPADGWFAIHGHLLPDGPAEVRVEVTAGGKVLGAETLVVQVQNRGEIAEAVRERLRTGGVPLVVDDPIDSRLYDYADPTMAAWFDRSPQEIEGHLMRLRVSGAADAQEIDALRHFAENGYLAVPGVISADHLARLNASLDHVIENGVKNYAFGSSERIENLHDAYPAIRELWTHPRVMRMLELIFGVPAKPCQTLSYVFGSQQQHHQDAIHLTPYPAGRMCGVWTALEDVQEGSGELMVFPKSHRLPRVYMADHGVPKVTDGDWTRFGEVIVPAWTRMIEENGFGPIPYRAKAGDVLIWHENLMHGGAPRIHMDRTRRSIVGHYFAEGAIAYYDSSGRAGVTHPA